jgi:hypothetical protein
VTETEKQTVLLHQAIHYQNKMLYSSGAVCTILYFLHNL